MKRPIRLQLRSSRIQRKRQHINPIFIQNPTHSSRSIVGQPTINCQKPNPHKVHYFYAAIARPRQIIKSEHQTENTDD